MAEISKGPSVGDINLESICNPSLLDEHAYEIDNRIDAAATCKTQADRWATARPAGVYIPRRRRRPPTLPALQPPKPQFAGFSQVETDLREPGPKSSCAQTRRFADPTAQISPLLVSLSDLAHREATR